MSVAMRALAVVAAVGLTAVAWRALSPDRPRAAIDGRELPVEARDRDAEVDRADAIRPARPTGSEPADSASPSRGAALFAEHGCGSCHVLSSADAKERIAVSLEGLSARYSAREIEDLLAAPPPSMPRAPLSAADRAALAAFLLGVR